MSEVSVPCTGHSSSGRTGPFGRLAGLRQLQPRWRRLRRPRLRRSQWRPPQRLREAGRHASAPSARRCGRRLHTVGTLLPPLPRRLEEAQRRAAKRGRLLKFRSRFSTISSLQCRLASDDSHARLDGDSRVALDPFDFNAYLNWRAVRAALPPAWRGEGPPDGRRSSPARLPLNLSRLGGRMHQLSPRHCRDDAAHAIGDKVEAAYRRGDLFEKRRRMMADWSAFCGSRASGASW
jgi:hypothetical protein